MLRPVRICYIDESGDTQAIMAPTQNVAPVCVVLGLVLDQAALHGLTQEFLTLKRRSYPGLLPRESSRLDWMLAEIKGSELRRALRTGMPRRNRRHTINFLDRLIKLLEDYQVRLVGRVWIKNVGDLVAGAALYSSSVQAICAYFHHLLIELDQLGFVIADSRSYKGNIGVSHSIFTQKFKVDGDEYDRILEMPTFGHSDNHVGIQIADLIASAMVYPMATSAYCSGHVQNVHVDSAFHP
ncbi:MAG: DUF3800 domain-containing protein, partial [Actinomycetota bacterium]|nr:DUF3800 domain-containing protein [Actinomycetota bacterium]